MKIKDMINCIDGRIVCCEEEINREVSDVCSSDMMSFVMSHADKDNAIITILNNINVLAVGVLVEASCIVIPSSIEISSSFIEKAQIENIPIISTNLSGFEVCGKIYNELNRN